MSFSNGIYLFLNIPSVRKRDPGIMGVKLFLTQVQLPEGQEQEAPQLQSHPEAVSIPESASFIQAGRYYHRVKRQGLETYPWFLKEVV